MSKQAFKRVRKALGLEVSREPLPAWAWPGGYPMYYVCKDGGTLCPTCANKEIDLIAAALHDEHDKQWGLAGLDVNYEDESLYCDHCSKQLESACGIVSRKIRQSFEIVTPESAAEGDASERGWIDEEGTPIVPDDDDIEEYGDESAAAVALAVKHIGSCVEASDYPTCQPGRTWYTSADCCVDYRTGAETRYSWFLDGFSDAEQLAIYAELTGRKVAS